MGNWTVQGPQIADLQLVDSPPVTAQSHQQPSQQPSMPVPRREDSIPIPVSQPIPDAFVDPAILSMRRRPTLPQEVPSTPVKVVQPSAVEPLPQNTPTIGDALKQASIKKTPGRRKGRDAAATLKAPFSNLDINSAAEQEHLDDTDEPTVRNEAIRRVSLTKTRTGKPMEAGPQAVYTGKKANRKKKAHQASVDLDDTTPEITRKGNGSSTFPGGKGWRQTPILQDQPLTASPGKTGRQPSKKQRAMELEAQNNGWGTEDATDIQELGEFDFASNLSKFDKRTVFAQIRTEDTTADDERLVSFNRTPGRPGTYGGKNLHPTENVLDSPAVNARRASTMESDSDASFDIESIPTTKRTISRASSRRPAPRKSSAMVDEPVAREIPRVPRSIRGGGYTGSSSHPTIGSPTPTRFTPPESPSASQIVQSAHFRIDTTNRVCPTITPGVMNAIEEVAEVEFGLSQEVMTESAGRGIAEVAMAQLGSNNRRSARTVERSVAIVFVGNHRGGARALAAARHLGGRGVRIVACVLGTDRKGVELERDVQKQAETLSKLGGVIRGWTDVRNYLRKIDGDTQPEIVIDGLLAPGKTFESLGSDDQRAVLEITQWINKSGGKDAILSIDIPSGINGSTGMPNLPSLPMSSSTGSSFSTLTSPIIGEAALMDGDSTLQVRANNVVCLGAPRIGLLRALQRASLSITSAPADALNWHIWVVDIGVNKAWKQSGMASSKGVRFGAEWIVPLKLYEGAEDGRT